MAGIHRLPITIRVERRFPGHACEIRVHAGSFDTNRDVASSRSEMDEGDESGAEWKTKG